MLIIPAIDLKKGKVVRLTQGRYNKKVYSQNPQETAKRWVGQGAKLIHVVDLDGAACGVPKNLEVVKKIAQIKGTRVEFGGGVRTEGLIQKLLEEMRIYRVVLSTLAFENRALLRKIIRKYKDKVIVSVDMHKNGTVALKGWRKEAGRQNNFITFAKKLSEMGIDKIIYTDIFRDGTLAGPRENLIEDFLGRLKKYKISVILAGGISTLDDIGRLRKLENKGLIGIIVGKALYEGRFTLSQALRAVRKEE